VFENVRFDFDKYGEQTGFSGFWKDFCPQQANLIDLYIMEAFHNLGCDLNSMTSGEKLEYLNVLPRHGHSMKQFYKILANSGFLERKVIALLPAHMPQCV
jgi:hypothetical protein